MRVLVSRLSYVSTDERDERDERVAQYLAKINMMHVRAEQERFRLTN